jgi:L-alanine-DL-glutamate epimerase-like enolase superfamily enzyme
VLSTGGVIPAYDPAWAFVERGRATMEAGFRCYRSGAADAPANGPYNTHERLNKMAEESAQAREGVGKNGDWCVDFHQRFDLSEAIRGCDLIKDLAPYFVEDPVRDEAFREDLPILRRQAKVPIAAGEEWGYRWDFHKLVENHDIDYIRPPCPTSAASPR